MAKIPHRSGTATLDSGDAMAIQSANQTVLESDFQNFLNTEYPGENPDDVFELYSATQVLKPRDLNPDELGDGVVDEAKDGGIDSFFVFLNGTLLTPESPLLIPGDPALRQVATNSRLEVFLIQSKNTHTWEEGAWEHLLASTPYLLNPSADDVQLDVLFHSDVVERTRIFRQATVSLAPKFPRVSFFVRYVTKGRFDNITPTIEARRVLVEEKIRGMLTQNAHVECQHVGAEALYKLAGTQYSQPAQLKFRQLIREPESFLGVAAVEDYLAFIRDESGAIRDELFEGNVRDFEGDNTVNEAIGATLATADNAEFWWLNNGITVLGDEVDSPLQVMTIRHPLIVNGLQTSHVLHRSQREGTLAPERLQNGVVVRVIASTDEDLRDRVIAGTNRQTQVPAAALFATQPLQHDIERILGAHGWWYERRKNRYRNLGKPAKKRIAITYLAQALITLLLGQPDEARARPGTVLGRKGGHDRVFPEKLDKNAYVVAVEVIKGVEAFLATRQAKAIMDEATNARFHLTAGYAVLALRLKKADDMRFDVNFPRLKRPLTEAYLLDALRDLEAEARVFQRANPRASRDSVFKSSDFTRDYLARVAKRNL
ncbi:MULTISPECIES: AIPR family protein [unclassified Pseudoclavibacter]|uniref:AIPR family protein n=1 Tax=unclassified Pseudoclavibacter TaxID=2615177 RepID=UPI001BABF418|nr:AIPR family protein [Pseudoclavibacter sp. Marseille-Q4354]MBS3180039.1 AIPR family protein [Pseudoclavibacter sp. Marseille-Q4354]